MILSKFVFAGLPIKVFAGFIIYDQLTINYIYIYIYILKVLYKVLIDSARQIKLELNIYLFNYIKTIIQTAVSHIEM